MTINSSTVQHDRASAPPKIDERKAQSTCYHDMLGVITRLYDLTGQLDLKEIIDRAKRYAPK